MNYWVSAVDARNREYAQLMRKFQVEANLHDASKRSMSEQLLVKHELQVSDSPSCVASHAQSLALHDVRSWGS